MTLQQTTYKFLQPKRGGSNYRQLFVNGRIRAEILYRETIGLELLTPEDVAKEYGLPVEAVLEAIDYCLRNQEVLDADTGRARRPGILQSFGSSKRIDNSQSVVVRAGVHII